MCLRYASRTAHSFWLVFATIVYMYYVYVLKSQKYKTTKIYIGSTSDLVRRVKQHNNMENISTRYGIPWKLIYYEAFESKQDALNREKG